jgi:cytochrome c oxidase cbb3-type subunit 3
MLVLLVFFAAGCEREKRDFHPPAAASAPVRTLLTDLQAGGQAPPPADARREQYENNAYQLSEGKRLFEWFNCSGCHAHGGGDSGPPLMDEQWRYGGNLEQIFETIRQGRPNGMPAFEGKIPESELWQIAAYVRSMSGNLSRSASPGRNDDMGGSVPEQMMEKQPPKESSSAAVEGTSP